VNNLAYTATYVAGDIGSMVIDFLGGIMAGLAGAAVPLVWVIVATLIIGLIGGLLVTVTRLGK
jgi:hypothetical protein